MQQNSKSISIGSKGSKTKANFIQRDLMTSDELRIIPDKNQIVIIRYSKSYILLEIRNRKAININL